MDSTLLIDGQTVNFNEGQTIIQAATTAGIYIPHLCHHPDYRPHGSCKLCTVLVNGRICSACTFPAEAGQEVIIDHQALNEYRKTITQMLFIEGNHFCPSCEKSGDCQLQAIAYHLNLLDSHFPFFYPKRNLDASHPNILIDHDRCIFCNLCVRASREKDSKNVFEISGRGINKRLIVNSETGKLKDSDIAINDAAVSICPTGAILIKRTAYQKPIGQRIYDKEQIGAVSLKIENRSDEQKT